MRQLLASAACRRSQPARELQLYHETSLHLLVTADRGSSLVRESNTSCRTVRTTSQHPPPLNGRQDGALLWKGLTKGIADALCLYQAPA